MGALFLAVEAIKVHNFRFLCDNVLRQIHHQARSPSIVVRGATEEAPALSEREIVVNWASRHVTAFMLLHYLAGIFLLIVSNVLSGGALWRVALAGVAWVLTLDWYWIVLITLVGVLYGVFAGLWLLGELVHVAIIFSLERLIGVAEFIQKKYADGTVGILGFGLLFLGFSLQGLGTYLGRPGAG